MSIRAALDRQVRRFGAAQQRGELPAHYIPIELDDARPVSDEAALFRPFGPLVHTPPRRHSSRRWKTRPAFELVMNLTDVRSTADFGGNPDIERTSSNDRL